MADNTIALQVQQPNFMSPFQLQQGALNIQDLMAQTQLRQQAVQQGQQSLRDQQELSRAWSDRSNVNPDTGLLDPEKVKGLFTNPNLYSQVVQKNTDALYNKQKTIREQGLANSEISKNQQEAVHTLREDAIAAYQSQLDKDPKNKQLATDVFNRAIKEGADQLNSTGIMGKGWNPPPDLTPELAMKRSMTYKERQEQENKEKSASRGEETPVMKEAAALYGKDSPQYKSALQAHITKVDAPSATTINMQGGTNTDKLSDKGLALYEEMVQAGKTVPKSKRGEVDYKLLNDMASKEVGGAGSGSITAGQQDYKTNQSILTDFGKGQAGKTVRSFNVSIDHLATLGELADALHNGDIKAINKLSNTVSSQTGHVAPDNFDAAKQIVGDEIVKGIVGAGGGTADREKAAASIDSAKSPEQLKGVITTYKKLMAGQLEGLKTQYETTGRKDFNEKYLTSSARAELEKSAPAKNTQSVTTQEHSQAMDWAKAHPDDPRAKKIMEHNGG